jgi:ribonucleoside-diphosphate reductase alpha chain
MSGRVKRGAMMAMLRCDHPDIEEFIEAKKKANRLHKFNLSVLITDAFMQSMEGNGDWPLKFHGQIYKTVRSRNL